MTKTVETGSMILRFMFVVVFDDNESTSQIQFIGNLLSCVCFLKTFAKLLCHFDFYSLLMYMT